MTTRGRGGDGVVSCDKSRYERPGEVRNKFEGFLSSLLMPDGSFTKTFGELEEQVRSNRPFWHQEPEGLPDDLRHLLGNYSNEAPRAPDPEAPDDNHCIGRVLEVPNTSAASDDVTYAVLRLAPEEIAGAMAWTIKSWDFKGFQGGEAYPPQLLCWISKAMAGLIHEDWRPFNVPVTFIRLISGAVIEYIMQHWQDSLHPA